MAHESQRAHRHGDKQLDGQRPAGCVECFHNNTVCFKKRYERLAGPATRLHKVLAYVPTQRLALEIYSVDCTVAETESLLHVTTLFFSNAVPAWNTMLFSALSRPVTANPFS